jgi:hypothetical protein
MKLEQVVHRMATDEGFASAVRQDLEGTLAQEGIRLTSDEVAALRAALRQETGVSGPLRSLVEPPGVWHSPQFDPQTS